MTTLGDLVRATTRADNGAAILTVRDHGYKLLGGAMLYDLIDRGRLGRTGEGRKTRVVLLDPSPVAEPSLEYGLARVRNHAEQRPRNAVLRLGGGRGLRDGIYGGLAVEQVLGPVEKKGLFAADRYPVRDLRRREDLIARLHMTLIGGRPPDEPTRRVAALLTVGDGNTGPLLDAVLDWPGVGPPPTGDHRRAVKAAAVGRGMDIVKRDWVALTTLAAILVPQQIAKTSAMFGISAALIPE